MSSLWYTPEVISHLSEQSFYWRILICWKILGTYEPPAVHHLLSWRQENAGSTQPSSTPAQRPDKLQAGQSIAREPLSPKDKERNRCIVSAPEILINGPFKMLNKRGQTTLTFSPAFFSLGLNRKTNCIFFPTLQMFGFPLTIFKLPNDLSPRFFKSFVKHRAQFNHVYSFSEQLMSTYCVLNAVKY